MTYITVCDARQPVPINIREGDRISMTSVSLIYDFYNITTQQEIIKYSVNSKEDDGNIYFSEYPGGDDIQNYYDTVFIVQSKFALKNQIPLTRGILEQVRFFYIYQVAEIEFKYTANVENGDRIPVESREDYMKLLNVFNYKNRIFSYFKTSAKFKYVDISNRSEDSVFRCSTADSRAYDYIHEHIIRFFPKMFEGNNDVISTELKLSADTDIGQYKTAIIDDVLDSYVISSNRLHYYEYIKFSNKCFDPRYYFGENIDSANTKGMFIFLRVNNYIHAIIKFIRDNYRDHYDSFKDNEVKYYDKSNVKNKLLISLVDKIYGGDRWKRFTPDFIKKLGALVYTTLKSWAISPGFYSLTSILDYHLTEIAEFDYNKYSVGFKTGKEEIVIIRPVGSDSNTSHGELYDLLWSKDSGRRFPDIIGPMKHINVHCEEINALESVFIDHDGNQ